MTGRSPLQTSVLAKFTAAFGEPHTIVEFDSHWSLRGLGAAINVLLNGGKRDPIVWVFNPHNPKEGFFHARITSESGIDALIQRIEAIVGGGKSNGDV